MKDRRQILGWSAATAGGFATEFFPSVIRRALAIPASQETHSLRDVKHVVILMMENRGFDHYFGTLRGVRGFGDRHPVPLESGKPVWFQSDGKREIPPYHLDTATTSALRVPVTPHAFNNAQAAWNQGKFGFWPKYKTQYAMGHYRRTDIPYQFALADAFTLCDAYHCSITTGTDPNRIMFWSGTNADPKVRAQGQNCTDADSEPDNLRCWVTGTLPEPGYSYAGSSFTWPTIPDVLEKAGISWRIYQDPNDNWTGAMHGGLAFESFRTARPGSPLYEKGMRHWSLEQLAQDARTGDLPQISWVLPPELWSEHPAPSSPAQGAEFAARVLHALTENPDIWSRTVLFQCFDENDGTFDHVPPPAPPSYDAAGNLAGASTVALKGEYFSDPERKHLLAEDTISGSLRPWGLGPRVPMYVISPWSKGGWVNSQVFDHTSVAQFLEKRFDVTVPGISAWHRAVCGDLTSAFDFTAPDAAAPSLPDTRGSETLVAMAVKRPKPVAPAMPEKLFQETGVRPSRALPYRLAVEATREADGLGLVFRNDGNAGAVFHVYDKRNLSRIPRRYTVEAGKQLHDRWHADDDEYDLWVLGPNGFVRGFTGQLSRASIDAQLLPDPKSRTVTLHLANSGASRQRLLLHSRVYAPFASRGVMLPQGRSTTISWDVSETGNWYDFTLKGAGLERRFAGRLETGSHAVSDPAMGLS